MKSCRRIFAVLLSMLLLSAAFLPMASANAPSISLTVLFTHDTHDHFYPDSEGKGGYTRLATLLEQQRKTGAVAADGAQYQYPTVTLDAGDFSMGTLFQTIYTTDAPELRAMGAMGYDVTTMGNHEFDYRGEGFAQMLQTAVASGDRLPQIVCSNYTPDFESNPETAELIETAMNSYPVNRSYIILEKEDGVGLDGVSPMRVAVFGLMGEESHSYAPMSGMKLEAPIEAAKRIVKEIEADGGADFVKTANGEFGCTTVHQVEVISKAIGNSGKIKCSIPENLDTVYQWLDIPGVERLGLTTWGFLDLYNEANARCGK